MYRQNGGVNAHYKAKYRSLIFNLKDANNPDLRRRVLSGEITGAPHLENSNAPSLFDFLTVRRALLWGPWKMSTLGKRALLAPTSPQRAASCAGSILGGII